MRAIRSYASAVVLLLLAGFGSAIAGDSPWEVRLLPDDPAWTWSSVFDINEAGHACGNVALESGSGHAVLWKDGIWLDVGGTYGMPEGFPRSVAVTLDDTGLVGGSAWTADYPDPERRAVAVLWGTVNGTVEVLHPVELGFAHSGVTAINNSGLVVLSVSEGHGQGDVKRSYVLDRNSGTGTLLPLGSGLASSHVWQINESGEMAGHLADDAYDTNPHAAIWLQPDTVRDLHDDIRALAPAVTWSKAFGVNEQGVFSGAAFNWDIPKGWMWTWSEEEGVVLLDAGPAGTVFGGGITEHMAFGSSGGFDDNKGAVWIDGIFHQIPTLSGATSMFASAANSSGVIVGDTEGPALPQRSYIAVPRDEGDFDGDALQDKWELQGYTHDNGKRVDLQSMGANPLRKDLFVEVDAMAGHRPDAETLQPVVDAFAAHDIALHIHIDDDLPFDPELGTLDTEKRYQWDEFDALKSAHFAEELESAVRYCVFAHRLATLTDSGLARGEPSSDFIVSLGAFVEASGSTDPWMQAGTFMHELGHTLGLRHGGADVTNRKPNYLSVMNYDFQKQGLRIGGQDGHFDYSQVKLADLHEDALIESAGLGIEPLVAGHQTLYRVVTLDPITFETTVIAVWSGEVRGSIDWNGSGAIDGTAVSADINGNGSTETLTGHHDWAALDFNGGTVGFGVGLPPPPPPPETEVVEELTVEEAKLIPPPPVEGLAGRAGRGSVRLSWTPVGPYGQGIYRVYRWSDTQGRVLVAETQASLISDRPGRGTWHYAVTVTDALGAESLDSNVLTIRSR